jgi:uncharacterized membrane protein YcjF (UPF0283 family)
MIKLFGYSLQAINTYFFNAVTFYHLINLVKIALPFSNEEVDEIKIYSSLIVAIFASIYWLIRGFNALMELPYKKKEREIKQRIIQLEEMYKKEKIMNEITAKSIEEMIQKDKK